VEGSVAIPLPCEGRKQKEEDAPRFEVKEVFYRKPLQVLKAALQGDAKEHMHWTLFREYWKRDEDTEPERIYSELYNTDTFIQEHEQLQKQRATANLPRPQLESVIAGIMLWSDSMQLTSFGTASLWPIYMFLGNQSKYIRCKMSLLTAQHVAYIPKVISLAAKKCRLMAIIAQRHVSRLLRKCLRSASIGRCYNALQTRARSSNMATLTR
jgi:hypothetical protein